MSTVTDAPPLRTRSQSMPAERLRTTMAAMRLSFTWFGTRKTLSPQQKARAAESFGAEGAFLSAGKKLVDTQHPQFKAVTAVRNQAVSYFKGVSLPYPDPGVRLVRHDELETIDRRMNGLLGDLDNAVGQLDAHFEELKETARDRLGSLYCEADYPDSLTELFGMAWDFPSFEPPNYLRQLSPELYQQECQRVQLRFNEAVQLAEQAFLEELSALVSHLSERLTGAEDGQPKVFRDSAVTNLSEFFERFRHLSVRSNAELDRVVDQAQAIVRGVQPQKLRDNVVLRQEMASQLSGVQSVLDGLLVDRPRRAIMRRPR